MNARNLLSLSGVLLVLGVAGYYWGMGQPAPLLGGETRSLPDYEADGIESWQTDEKGLLLRHLEAKSAVHYPNPDQAITQQPTMTLYRHGVPVWRVQATEGVSQDQNKLVHLQKGVQGQRIEAGAVPVTVNTPELMVYPSQETMNTDAAVTINSPQGRIQARGMDADLKGSTLNLHSEVRGTYANSP